MSPHNSGADYCRHGSGPLWSSDYLPCLLIILPFLAFAFALAQNFEQLVYSRFLEHCWVVCDWYPMVAEWFNPRDRLGRRHLWRLGNVDLRSLPGLSLYCGCNSLLAGQINWRLAIDWDCCCCLRSVLFLQRPRHASWQGLRALRQRPRVGRRRVKTSGLCSS